ncbi:MAG: 50S ribosomal protein L11 methyltransferase [Prevotellaceae bacterium]|jgi:ribosomal protein L11 methyltransferase|nr:50S ribosomal protein L11 methyltransferase [Prevotellaceae bacterium]
MDYIELQVQLQPCAEATRDLLIAELGGHHYDAFTETDAGFNAYIPCLHYDERTLKVVFYRFREQTEISYRVEFISDRNWNALWESGFEPVVIAQRCTIRAPFHKGLPKTDYEILIEPNGAFGTGHHHTTHLMVEALLEAPVKQAQVLDMGCGTGILAILAAKLGAKKFVDAIDTDMWAKNSTLDNARRNRVAQKIRVMLGDAAFIQREKYHLIFANINRNVLLDDMNAYARGLKPHGRLFVSGFYDADATFITAEAIACGLNELDRRSRQSWALLVFGKKPQSESLCGPIM